MLYKLYLSKALWPGCRGGVRNMGVGCIAWGWGSAVGVVQSGNRDRINMGYVAVGVESIVKERKSQNWLPCYWLMT